MGVLFRSRRLQRHTSIFSRRNRGKLRNIIPKILYSLDKKIKAYEEEFLGSRDSHSDSGADGGTDRTGNDLVHGLRSILRKNPGKVIARIL